MNRSESRAVTLLPLCLLLAHCGGDDAGRPARIQTQLASATVASSGSAPKFRAGAATSSGLESLKYQISTIMICESLEVSGSGFNNPTHCIELYKHDDPNFHYGLQDDWSALADKARATDSGFIDLLSASSRQPSSRPMTTQAPSPSSSLTRMPSSSA